MFNHEAIEKNVGLMIVMMLVAISIGGLVEIVPLFFINDTVEKVDGVRPYTPLELRGRDIYVREGCFLCHSQMIRPFRDEQMRYGHYSLAAESQYDHPFQWGSKRTGPDLARVGKKFSNEWHVRHLMNPQSMVPESVMPTYAFLQDAKLDISDVGDRMAALRITGVPYSSNAEEMERNTKQFGPEVAKMLHIPDAQKNLIDQAQNGFGGMAGNYDGKKDDVTEMDALVAYLQVLGTMVDFKKYSDDAFVQSR